MFNVVLHLLSDGGDRVPCLIDQGHPVITLDNILLLKINIKTFLCIALLGGLDREDNVLSYHSKGETDRPYK